MITRKEKRREFKNKNQKDKFSQNFPQAKKSLGQNFLNDEKFLNLIVETANLKKTDNVLEVGPGTGLLTDKLERAPKKVICIEKDRRMVKYLVAKYGLNKEKQKEQKIEIIEGDILEIDLPKFLKERNFGDYKVVANIPYYITGKLLRLLLETEVRAKSIVLLIQKEVAERVCSESGSMNILAVSVQYYADIRLVAVVPREVFSPIPKVDSAIIHATPFLKERESVELEKGFFKVVKSGFSSPRKKLLNNLASGLKLEKDKLTFIFSEFGWDENVRAQNLSIKQWKELRDKISKNF
ncbi:ribosomal RNA small subunit methyltransferase A [bacterium]|jgi:16S rRNA (adenine1518-N6/adenine1519-N6)-dimethyltransferase|nr:ribosomal RNA small subunit methyltransferase A [bacterium]MBT4251638.1 ribosomal RNA small subunit methyltransferase A [bacterium]MBT4597687.1 ribosomal RNA small subunit methyltransferase A [bacterium]MBT6753700.1 ribosomal RNA small subunit methyltransferase A [bacterium]MBT7037837.1 ribosomal RNA small subunit methyltransferase A [bacterium]